jgi:hypothetical protein
VCTAHLRLFGACRSPCVSAAGIRAGRRKLGSFSGATGRQNAHNLFKEPGLRPFCPFTDWVCFARFSPDTRPRPGQIGFVLHVSLPGRATPCTTTTHAHISHHAQVWLRFAQTPHGPEGRPWCLQPPARPMALFRRLLAATSPGVSPAGPAAKSPRSRRRRRAPHLPTSDFKLRPPRCLYIRRLPHIHRFTNSGFCPLSSPSPGSTLALSGWQRPSGTLQPAGTWLSCLFVVTP